VTPRSGPWGMGSDGRPVVHRGAAGALAGVPQPWSRHRRWNGVKTLNGVPSAVVTSPGATA